MRVIIILLFIVWVYWCKAVDLKDYSPDSIGLSELDSEKVCCCETCECFHTKSDSYQIDYFYFSFEVEPVFIEVPNFLKIFLSIKKFFKNFTFYDFWLYFILSVRLLC